MTNSIDVHEFYEQLDRENIVLSFRGAVTPELMTAILEIVEGKMDRFNEPPRLRKKLFNIMVECIQNLYHHNAISNSTKKDELADSSVLLIFAKNPTGYTIITGNYMHTREVDQLQQRLEEINDLTPSELKERYREVLNDGKRSSKGGGGLGMIDIARRSGKKLNFEFLPFGDKTFFSLNIDVNKKADLKAQGNG